MHAASWTSGPRRWPGLVAAFIFAVQMLNFPVAAGTSGHLLGGALAAILVGPYTGVLCVSVVLLMQGILFADGGLTALGVNITDMAHRHRSSSPTPSSALLGGAAAQPPLGDRRLLRRRAALRAGRRRSPSPCCTRSAAPRDVAIGKVATAMVGVHVLIGIGEAADHGAHRRRRHRRPARTSCTARAAWPPR